MGTTIKKEIFRADFDRFSAARLSFNPHGAANHSSPRLYIKITILGSFRFGLLEQRRSNFVNIFSLLKQDKAKISITGALFGYDLDFKAVGPYSGEHIDSAAFHRRNRFRGKAAFR